MLTLVIALAAGALAGLGLHFGAGLALLYVITVGVLVVIAVYFLIFRIVSKKIQAIMEIVQRDMMANRIEKAIRTLENTYPYSKWLFYHKAMINAQVGSIYYLKRDFAKAFGYLQNGFTKHWGAMGMLAISYMHKHKHSKMIETFNKAVMGTKNEPVLWELYAFCLNKIGEKEKAISTLEKGLKKIKDHENMTANLAALKDGRKMKMQPYGDLWYQFHLESQGALIKKQTKAMTGRRKTIVRR
jgi:tetratricopeptide (TPR) repeat protein